MPFTLDLVAAVTRQRTFMYKMVSGAVNWTDFETMQASVSRYRMFMILMGRERYSFLVPTLGKAGISPTMGGHDINLIG